MRGSEGKDEDEDGEKVEEKGKREPRARRMVKMRWKSSVRRKVKSKVIEGGRWLSRRIK